MISEVDNSFVVEGKRFVHVKGEERKVIEKHAYNLGGMIRLLPRGELCPIGYKNIAKLIKDFEFHLDDIMVVGHMKTGTTWLQEIIWTMVHNPNLDHKDASLPLLYRSPVFEEDGELAVLEDYYKNLSDEDYRIKALKSYYPNLNVTQEIGFRYMKILPRPRIMKSHLHMDLLPPSLSQKCKVLYITRDPRGMMASMMSYSKKHPMLNFRGTMSDMIDLYLQDKMRYSPYWPHVQEAWTKKEEDNFLFLFYEDLIENTAEEFGKIATFLRINRTQQQIQNVIQYTAFNKMKDRSQPYPPMIPENTKVTENNTFFGKGIPNHWTEIFSKEEIDRVTDWMETNTRNMGDGFKKKYL